MNNFFKIIIIITLLNIFYYCSADKDVRIEQSYDNKIKILKIANKNYKFELIYENQFDNQENLKDWEIVSGNWEINNGKLIQKNENNMCSFIFNDKLVLDNFYAEVDLKIISGKDKQGALCCRVTKNDNLNTVDIIDKFEYYGAGVGTWKSKYGLFIRSYRMSGLPERLALSQEKDDDINLPIGWNNTIAFVSIDDFLYMITDDKIVLDARSILLKEGKVALRTWQTSCEFDNLKIYQLKD